MVFAERFLLELRSCCFVHHHFAGCVGTDAANCLWKAVQFAGDELETRVVESGAAVVGHRDPAVKVGVFIVARHGEHVVGVPGKIVREVGSLDLLLARAGIFERHEQRGPVVKIRGNFREAVALGKHACDDVVADSPNRAVVVGEQSGFDFFMLGGAAVLIRADQRDFLAHVFVEKFRGLEEIVFVILFDDAKLVRIGERAKMYRGGIDGGSDVHEL